MLQLQEFLESDKSEQACGNAVWNHLKNGEFCSEEKNAPADPFKPNPKLTTEDACNIAGYVAQCDNYSDKWKRKWVRSSELADKLSESDFETYAAGSLTTVSDTSGEPSGTDVYALGARHYKWIGHEWVTNECVDKYFMLDTGRDINSRTACWCVKDACDSTSDSGNILYSYEWMTPTNSCKQRKTMAGYYMCLLKDRFLEKNSGSSSGAGYQFYVDWYIEQCAAVGMKAVTCNGVCSPGMVKLPGSFNCVTKAYIATEFGIDKSEFGSCLAGSSYTTSGAYYVFHGNVSSDHPAPGPGGKAINMLCTPTA